MRYGIAVASVLGLALSVGCSSIPTSVDDAREGAKSSAERVSEERDSAGDRAAGSAGIELSAQDENILNNVASVLEECPLDGAPFDRDRDPYYMRQGLYQCEAGHPRVDGQLSGIDAEKQSHPDVRQARADVDALEEKIEEWQQEIADKEAAMVEDRETNEAYQAFLERPQEQAVELMFGVREGTIPGDGWSSFTPDHMLGERVEGAASLAGMGEECREQFDNDRDFHRYSEDSAHYPANRCAIIEEWQRHMGNYLNLHAAHKAEELSDEVGRMIDSVEGDGTTTDGNRARLADLANERAELEAFYGGHFETADAEMNEEVEAALASIVDQQSRYDEVLVTSGQEMRWDSSSLHTESEVRSALDAVFNGTPHTIRAYGVGDADWNIDRSIEGHPVARHHNVGVATQHSDEDFCRIYNFRAVGEYDGTGYTSASISTNLDREIYFITACP